MTCLRQEQFRLDFKQKFKPANTLKH